MNYILTCVFVLLFLDAHSKDQSVILEWKFAGIEDGYDHLNRCKLIVDGKELPVSKSFKQSEWGMYPVTLSKKTPHRVQLINEAFYNGNWVEHTFENGFSINAVCEFEIDAAEVAKVRVEFDLNGAAISMTRFDEEGNDLVKKKTRFKGRHYPMTINWKFSNIEKGYDHRSRLLVFVDDREYGMSPESIESIGGLFELEIPKGEHAIRIVAQSCVNGKWQDHTITNNFSVEAVYEKRVDTRNPVHVTLVIDLNNEQTVNEWR